MENHTYLTDELLRIVTDTPHEPVQFIDPASQRKYVLMRFELYERMRELLDDVNLQEVYPAIDRAFAEGWNDPKMDDYDDYEENRR